MLHRNTLIVICAIFCAVAVGAGLFVANLSKQSGLITQQAGTGITSLPTTVAAEPTPIADVPTAASEPAPTSAPIAVLDPAEPTATSRPAPTSTPAATAAPISNAPTYIEYTVQKGDLLNSIAKKYNVTTEDILAINRISNADSLTVGQVIRIPKVSG
jgi:peptidoglycan DL-endopeptidase LytF